MMPCPNCQFDNPIGMKFCGNCGAPLPTTALAPQDERRVVTALFGDVSGFTAMSERLDPEEVKEIMNRCLSRLAEVARDFGGTVDKFGGDSILAYFGYPVAHEDDPERAVRTALAMQEVMSEFSDELVARGYPRLQMRVGLNTGLVLAGQMGGQSGHHESTIMGDTVNTASRLQGATTPGRVGVGESTWRATEHAFEFDAPRAVQVKGKAEPLPLYEVIGIRSERASVRGLAGKGLSAPLIGRSRELQELRTAYAEVVAGRRAMLATVWGVAGSGKSRLIADFAAELANAEPPPLLLRGRCLPFGQGSITYWPLGEMVKQECGISESDALAEVERKLTVGIEAMLIAAEGTTRRTEVERLVTHIAATMNWGFGSKLIGMSEASRREERLAAWQRFFSLKAAVAPLVIFFEDIHWAEASLLDFIEQLVQRLGDIPALILCASRPELRESRADWGATCSMVSVTLHPLDEQESITLVNALLVIDELPDSVRDLIVRRAEGNPFYVEELIRLLVEDRKIERREGRWVAVAGIEQTFLVPENVNYLLSARIDRLATEQKRVLQEAAVVGREFWRGAVNNLLNPQLSATRVAASLVGLIEREMVESVLPSSFLGEDEYSFRHVLTHDVAYEMLPHRERSRKHQLAAQWLERAAGDRIGEYVERIAYHYQQAVLFGERAAALPSDNDIDELRTKACYYLRIAADKNMDLQDFRKALGYYRSGAEIGAVLDDDTVKLSLAVGFGRASLFLGNYDDAEAQAFVAINVGKQVKDTAAMVSAMKILAQVYRNRADYSKAIDVYQRLFAECQKFGYLTEAAQSLIGLAMLHMQIQQPGEASSLAHQAFNIAQASDNAVAKVQAANLLAAIYSDVEANLPAAERINLHTLQLLQEANDRLQLSQVLINLALICYDLGKYIDAAGYSREAIAKAQELGYKLVEMRASNTLAHALLALVQPDEAMAHLYRALAISAALNEREVLPEIRRGLAEAHLARGENEAALEQAELACAVTLPEDTYSLATTQCTLGRVLAMLGRDEEAEAAFRRSLATLEGTAYLPTLAHTCESYAAFLSNVGREVEAAPLREQAAALRERIANPPADAGVLLPDLGEVEMLN